MIFVGESGGLYVSGVLVISGAFPGVPPGTHINNLASLGSGWRGFRCLKCNTRLSPLDHIQVDYCSGYWVQQHYCHDCVDYNRESHGWWNRRDWILAAVPFISGTPLPIVADWLEDRQMEVHADYLRSLSSR